MQSLDSGFNLSKEIQTTTLDFFFKLCLDSRLVLFAFYTFTIFPGPA